jgi:hypothetical protein
MNELNIIRINEAINILKAQINLLERKDTSWAHLVSIESKLKSTLDNMTKNILDKQYRKWDEYIKIEDKYLERKDYDLDLCFGQWLIKNNYVNAHR